MKSFADWTQEIADTVGEVTHHWETRKEAELKDIERITIGGINIEIEDAIAPNWQAPSAPILGGSGGASLMFTCEQCQARGPDVGHCRGDNGTHYYLCDACARANNFTRVR